MRWIFALLLIGNGIYYFFQSYMVPPVARTVSPSEQLLDLGQPVVLLSEVERVEEIAPVVDVQEAIEEQNPVCLLLGAFKEEVSAKQMQGRLQALDIQFKMLPFEVEGKPDYWVYIPPKATRKEAIKGLRALQLKKIDSYLITEGELANGISLGLFSEQSRAEKLYEKRKKQGFEVDLKEVPRVYTEIWLVSEQGEFAKFSEELWDKIKQGHDDIERRKNYCNSIASPEKLD